MNLFAIHDESVISKTTLFRKLTLGGVTKAYPVYRVRLDQLFYNDQNDRIATWITQYKNDPGNKPFAALTREEYNKIIEGFIIDSNPGALEKTKNNIALVNQREPGVVLADGRIVDGNRRFTCLRLLQEEDKTARYLETVILDASAESDRKQIKMLELAIQHGEEQRVDYNLIDMAMGAYHDIVESGLLTIEEYVTSTNIPMGEVRKKLETAKLIIEFLEFMGVPKQYHIAREMQVYSVFFEMVPLLKRCETEEAKVDLKRSVFSNTMMGTFADQRKYIRNVKAMMDSGFFSAYMKKQKTIVSELEEKKSANPISNKKDLDVFIKANEDIAEDLQVSMDRSLNQSKKEQTKSKPAQIVTKSLSMLMDIDTRILDKLSEGEKEKLNAQLGRLTEAVSLIRGEVEEEKVPETGAKDTERRTIAPSRFLLAPCKGDRPTVYCRDIKTITNLNFAVLFSAAQLMPQQKKEANCIVYFVSESGEELCPRQEIAVKAGENTKVMFSLGAGASGLEKCYLVIKSPEDSYNEASCLLEFPVKLSFTVAFDF